MADKKHFGPIQNFKNCFMEVSEGPFMTVKAYLPLVADLTQTYAGYTTER